MCPFWSGGAAGHFPIPRLLFRARMWVLFFKNWKCFITESKISLAFFPFFPSPPHLHASTCLIPSRSELANSPNYFFSSTGVVKTSPCCYLSTKSLQVSSSRSLFTLLHSALTVHLRVIVNHSIVMHFCSETFCTDERRGQESSVARAESTESWIFFFFPFLVFFFFFSVIFKKYERLRSIRPPPPNLNNLRYSF